MIPKVIRRTWRHGRGHGLLARSRYVARKAIDLTTNWIAGRAQDAAVQMIATCRQHRRNPDTAFVHLVLSWQSDEHPTPDQAFVAARHALKRLGADGHEALFGVHRDTRNAYIHILFSRVHPITGRLLNLWDDYKILELACREIELLRGWPPDNGRFEAIPDASGSTPQVTLQSKGPAHWAAKKLRRIAGALPRPSDYDSARGTGQLPLNLRLPDQMLARIATLATHASDWHALHDGLAALGLEYRTVRRGAVIALSDTTDAIAASHLSPDLGMGRLQARLGPFVAARDAPVVPAPSGPTKLELRGKLADEVPPLKGLRWLARGTRSRLHASLFGHRHLRDIISGIRFSNEIVLVRLVEDGWVRSAGGTISIGDGHLAVQQCLVATILAQSKGWDEIAIRGEADIGATLIKVTAAMGLEVRSFNGRPVHGNLSRPVLPDGLLCLTEPERITLTGRAGKMIRNAAARQVWRERRERRLGMVETTVAGVAAHLDDMPAVHRRVKVQGLRRALRGVLKQRTDLRPAAEPLPARDAHKLTGPLLSAMRHQRLRPDHPALTFAVVDRILGPLIAAGHRGQTVMGDLVNLPQQMTFPAHRDEDARTCGYEFTLFDADQPTLGRIRGSRMTEGCLPTGGKSPQGKIHVDNLGEALGCMREAMRDRITLMSRGQHDRALEAENGRRAMPPPVSDPDQSHDQ